MEHGVALGPGARIEEFEVVRELGAGGFGITYLARDLQLDRAVAVKEYLPRDWGTRRQDGTVGPRSSSYEDQYEWGLERFVEEARKLARLNHPQIVRVYRVFGMGGTAYMVMEYVEGRSLEEELKSAGRLGEARVRGILEGLADGLAEVPRGGSAAPGHQAGERDAACAGGHTGTDRLWSGAAVCGPGVAAVDGGADAGVCAVRAVPVEGTSGTVDGHLRAGSAGVHVPEWTGAGRGARPSGGRPVAIDRESGSGVEPGS